MADESPRLRLPLIAAAQAQKHVTHNEALTLLDTLVQLSVRDRGRALPPASPSEGDCHIVAGSPGGAWTGWAGRIARYEDGRWRSLLPGTGWAAFVQDEGRLAVWDGSAWSARLAGYMPAEAAPSFAAIAAGEARLVHVAADETNGGAPTLYFFDGAALHWLPMIEVD